MLVVIGLIIFVLFQIRGIAREPDVYAVTLRDRFGPTNVVSSTDREYVRGIADIIQYAIDRKNNPNAVYPEVNNRLVPVPEIQKGTLFVGSTKYSLGDMKSVKIRGIAPQSNVALFFLLISAGQQLAQLASRHSGRWHWIADIVWMLILRSIL